ncbi:MAG: FG-GAP-like repeat-containing protein, partial [Flavobacterium sp.]
LFADFNNEGNKDLFVTTGYGRDMTNRDFVKFYANERLKYLRGEKGDNMFRMLQGITVTPLHNYMFVNNGNLGFIDSSSNWGLDQPGLSQGAAYADLDNDGDLDLVVNHLNAPVGLYRNMLAESGNSGNYIALNLKMPGKNSFAIGSKVIVYTPAGQVMQENYAVHGFQSSMQEPLHVCLPSGKIDSVIIIWPDGNVQSVTKAAKTNSSVDISYILSGKKFSPAPEINTVFHKTGISFPFKHTEPETNDFKVQPLMPNMISYNGPGMAKGDINKDGLDDIYIGGAKGQAGKILLQQSSGNFIESPQSAFETDAFSEDAAAVFFDADNDGDLDLYVVSGGYAFDKDDEALQDRLYINDNGVFTKNKNALPVETTSGSCVKVADIDNDGHLDLFVGGRVVPGRYPEAPESFILLNDGKGVFRNATAQVAPSLQHIGMVTDAEWVDINKDGKKDLLVCGEWMTIHLFENNNGKLSEASSKYFKQSLSGWWNRLCLADMDGDGDLDLVAGNWGTNSAIHVNKNEPATLYYNDFDNNGSIEPLICYYIQGKEYPMASRDDITDQMVSLRQKFPTYDSYSEATISEILSPEQLKSANRLYADHFETTYFENRDGVFIQKPLPVQANFSPVYAISCEDFNHDGKPDILMAGNIDQARIKIGKIDANYGILFTGDGKGNFTYQPQLQSGLSVKGCVRDIIQIKKGEKGMVIFGINNQFPAFYNY